MRKPFGTDGPCGHRADIGRQRKCRQRVSQHFLNPPDGSDGEGTTGPQMDDRSEAVPLGTEEAALAAAPRQVSHGGTSASVADGSRRVEP